MFAWLAEKFGVDRVVFALSVARLGDAGGNSILFVVIPLFVAKTPAPWLGLSEEMRVGILVSAYGLVSTVLEPMVGALIDRIGRRKLLIQLGLLVVGVATLGYLMVGRYIWMLVLRIVQGAGLALTVPGTMALMAAVTQSETRGSAMGFLTMMRMLGFAVGPLIGGFLMSYFGFSSAFIAGAVMIGIAIVLVQVWVTEPESGSRGMPPERRRELPGFFDRRLWVAPVVGAGLATLFMATSFTIITTLEKQFNQRLHQNAFWFGIAFSALTVSRLVLQIPFGWLSDRYGRRPPIIGGLLVLAPATALLGFVSSTWELIGLRVFQGIGSAGVAAPAFALAGDASEAGMQGRQMSLATVGFSLGLAIGPLLAGFLAGYFFSLPFLVGGALCLLGAGLIWWFTPEAAERFR